MLTGKKVLLVGSACCVAGFGSPALCQTPANATSDQTSPEDSASGADGEREIVVTAQKREERLIDVPISIVALTGEELQNRNIVAIDDLSASVPGLFVQSSGGFQRRIQLRGISNVFGPSSLIGLYLDEASATSARADRQLDLRTYDLERVEVLRGPQGTLYGEGSAGGTIRFITRNPVLGRFGLTADAAVLLTEDGSPSQRLDTAINIPLGEQLALRLVGGFEHRGGWIDQPAAQRENVNDQDIVDVRAKLLWRPAPNFTAQGMVVIHRNDAGISFGEDANGNLTQVFNLTTRNFARDDFELYNLTLNLDLGAFNLLSTSTHINQDKRSGYGYRLPLAPPGPYDVYVPLNLAPSRIWSQELRLSTQGTGPFHGTVGVYYRRAVDTQRFPLQYFAPSGGQLPAPLPDGASSARRSESNAWAVFGDASLDLSERFTIGAGLRYSDDHLEQQNGPNINALGPVRRAAFDTFNPRAYAQFHWNREVTTYGSVAKGFRSGGFNTSATQPPFGPETVWTYELGTKVSLNGGRFRADVALFYSDYSDFIINGVVITPVPGNFFSNAGDARVKGVEWSVDWAPSPGWTLGFSGNYVDSRITSVAATNAPLAVGDRINFFPKYGFTAFVQRDFSFLGRSGFARVDYVQQGQMVYRSRNNGPQYFDTSDVLNMLNANISIELSDALSLGLIAQNILNDRGRTDPTSLESTALRSRPRSYGLELGVRF